jgi:hypothetical protein
MPPMAMNIKNYAGKLGQLVPLAMRRETCQMMELATLNVFYLTFANTN